MEALGGPVVPQTRNPTASDPVALSRMSKDVTYTPNANWSIWPLKEGPPSTHHTSPVGVPLEKADSLVNSMVCWLTIQAKLSPPNARSRFRWLQKARSSPLLNRALFTECHLQTLKFLVRLVRTESIPTPGK